MRLFSLSPRPRAVLAKRRGLNIREKSLAVLAGRRTPRRNRRAISVSEANPKDEAQ